MIKVPSKSDREKAARVYYERTVKDRAIYPQADPSLARLAVLCCHYNWAGFSRPVLNLKRFLRQMDLSGIPVYGVEAVRPGFEPIMEDNPNWKIVRVSDRGVMWQKEALLNVAAELPPADIRNLAVIDPDICFENSDWVEQSLDELERAPAIQPFEMAVWTDRSGNPTQNRKSSVVGGGRGHPGFAWVFHRGFFEQVGLYPYALTGTGDTVAATGILNLDLEDFPTPRQAIGEPNLDVYWEWRKRCRAFMGERDAGFTEGTVWHEWHGSMADRRYAHRHRMMARVDVLKHLRITDEGWLSWSQEADREIILETSDYFTKRMEDG